MWMTNTKTSTNSVLDSTSITFKHKHARFYCIHLLRGLETWTLTRGTCLYNQPSNRPKTKWQRWCTHILCEGPFAKRFRNPRTYALNRYMPNGSEMHAITLSSIAHTHEHTQVTYLPFGFGVGQTPWEGQNFTYKIKNNIKLAFVL